MLATSAVLSSCGSSTRDAGGPVPSSPHGSGTHDQSSAPIGSSGPSSTATATPTGRPTADAARVTKLLVFIVENHSLDQMRDDLPFTFGLAQRYGYATHYQAITHPSLPNYLAITGGTTFGVSDDRPPSSNGVHGTSVFGQALAMGRTATVYAEGMDGSCATEDSGRYAVRHNPWAFYLDERVACQTHDVPLTELADDVAAGGLPNVGMVIPDVCNDGHDCGLDVADTWLRDQLGAVMSGPDWTTGRLAIVITADEDDYSQDNTVLTVVVHPSLHGSVVTNPLTHYSLSRAYSEVLGATPLSQAAQAQSLLSTFDLATRH